jgi:UDP-glucose 4-epimerase
MRILVTGAAGFIGGHLTERLLAQDHQVLALDDLSFGRRENIPRDADFWRVDLGDISYKHLAERIGPFNPQYVVHLAAIHFIPYCMKHPEKTFAVNARGTDMVVRALLDCPSATKIILASTMDVYAPSDNVHSEMDEPSPRNVYGLSKMLAEQIVSYGTRACHHLSAVSLRFSNVYGPGETNAHLIPDAIERVTSRTESHIRMGYLAGARDFLHVSDVVEGIITCLFTDTGTYEVFNLGTGIATPVRRVVEIIRDAFGDDRTILEDPGKLRSFDRKSLTPDITKIQSHTSWSPKMSIEQGLNALVQEIQFAR